MKKTQLIRARKHINISQEQMAELLHIDTSSYNRREKGKTKINQDEWEKMAQFLEVPLEEIYQPEDGFILVKGNNNAVGNNNQIYTIPQSLWESQQKYIHKLEQKFEQQQNRHIFDKV